LEEFYSLYEKIEADESAASRSSEELIIHGKLVKNSEEIKSRFIFKPEADTYQLSVIEINIL
jgi:hypothetical protein